MTLAKNGAVLALVCALTVALVGCGSSGGGSRSGLVKASGILTYNGQPVDGATLDFRPMDESVQNGVAAGFTDEKGMFSLMTDRPGDGALPGKYRVSVKKQVEMIDGMTRDEYVKANDKEGNGEVSFDKNKLKTEDLLPAKYNDPLNSPLEVEIPSGGIKNLEIKLED